MSHDIFESQCFEPKYFAQYRTELHQFTSFNCLVAERMDFICLWLNLLSDCKFNSPVVSRDWVTPIYESPINFGSNTTNFPTNQNSVITVTSEKVVDDDFLLHLYKYTSIIISDYGGCATWERSISNAINLFNPETG